MTSGKHRKRMVRRRAAITGESYTAALHHLRSHQEGPVSNPAPTPTAPAKVLARCSFCNKPNTSVQKLIAGPGVYICDECVGLCQSILETPTTPEESAAQRAAFENRSGSVILNSLPALARTADSVEQNLRDAVQRLLDEGTTWEDISDRLGLAPEAARSRFER